MDKQLEKNEPEQVEVPVWWNNGGGRIIRRDCLPVEHPEHTYNYMKNVMGLTPEKYGIENPKLAKYKDWSREQLIDALEDAIGTLNWM